MAFRFLNKNILSYITELLIGLMRHFSLLNSHLETVLGSVVGCYTYPQKSHHLFRGAEEAGGGAFKNYQRRPHSSTINLNKYVVTLSNALDEA